MLAPDPPDIHRASGTEIALFAALAVAACVAVATPVLAGWLSGEMAGVIVPFAQLTPLLVATLFYWRLRPGSFREVFGLRWTTAGTLLGVAILVIVSACQLLLGLALGWELKPTRDIVLAATAVVPIFLLQSLFAIGEEWGWRGWLATRTQHLGFAVAAAISSTVWVVWHLPALAAFPEMTTEQAAAYLLNIAAWGPLLLALRCVTGSVWPAVFAHGSINSIRLMLTQSVADSTGVDWTVEILGWILCLLAATALIRRQNSST